MKGLTRDEETKLIMSLAADPSCRVVHMTEHPKVGDFFSDELCSLCGQRFVIKVITDDTIEIECSCK